MMDEGWVDVWDYSWMGGWLIEFVCCYVYREIFDGRIGLACNFEWTVR